MDTNKLHVSRVYNFLNIIKVTREFLIAFALASNLFLWGIQIAIGPAAGVPVNILLIPVIYLFMTINLYTLRKSVILCCFLLFILLIQAFMQDIVIESKTLTIFTILILSLIGPIIYEMLMKSKKDEHFFLIQIFRFFIAIQLFLMIFQLFLVHLGIYKNPYFHYFLPTYRTSGFFAEPSHLAISLSPFYYLSITNLEWFKNNFRYRTVALLFLIFFLCPSTTLFLVIFMSTIFRIFRDFQFTKKKLVKIFILIFFLFSSVFVLLEVSESSKDRIISIVALFQGAALENVSNYSSMVFVKGFQMAHYGLTNYPLGVGINNMQMLNEYSSIAQFNEKLYILNKNDGASLFFKMTAEFGILGILFFIFAIQTFMKCFRNKSYHLEQGFLFCLILSTVRGVTYFDGGLIIPIMIAVSIFWEKINNFSKIFIFQTNSILTRDPLSSEF